MTAPQTVLIGAGGHAAVLLDCLARTGHADVRGALALEPERWGSTVAGVTIWGDNRLLADMAARGITHFVLGVGGAGNNRPRQALYAKAIEAGLAPVTVIHPTAIISPTAYVGPGSQILPGAIVNACAVLGTNVIVNTGAIVEHDCRVGDHVHVATGARLAGTVTVETGAHIGAGATIIQGRRIGAWAVVGAGSVVTRDVEGGTTAVGVPARPIVRRPPESDRRED